MAGILFYNFLNEIRKKGCPQGAEKCSKERRLERCGHFQMAQGQLLEIMSTRFTLIHISVKTNQIRPRRQIALAEILKAFRPLY